MKQALPIVVLIAVVAGIALFARKDSGEGDTAGGKKKENIAVILMQEDQFFRMNEIGMRDAAKELGVGLKVSNCYGAPDKEASLVDTYIAQKVDALLVSPLSATASVTALQRAHDKGIRVVTYNTDIDADFTAYSITSDQVALGRTTGEAAKKYINDKLGGKAKVAIIAFISQAPDQGPLRPQGFKDALKGMDGVEYVAQQDAWLAAQAADVVDSILQGNPELDIVWCANEGGTVGAVTAVRNAGKAGKVAVYGTDMSEQLADFLLADDGILHAVTAQRPYDMGKKAVENAVRLVRDEPVKETKVLLEGELFSHDDPDKVKAFKKRMAEIAGDNGK